MTDNKPYDIHTRVELWQTEMREKYNISDKYEILMNYGYSDSDDDTVKNVEAYIKHCDEWNTLLLKKIVDGSLWWFQLVRGEGKIFKAITREEHLSSLDSGIEREEFFTQEVSDLFAHFIQIICVLQRSEWYKMVVNGSLQLNMNHDGKTRASMPSLELTVFALVYIRQLISTADNIVNRSCKQYKCFIENTQKRNYIAELQKNFNHYLNDDLATMSHYTLLAERVQNNREFIEAFFYGALIIHGDNNPKDKNCEHYKSLYLAGEKKRPRFIWELNNTVLRVLENATKIAVLLQKDFAKWKEEGVAPKSNVFWQETMFSWLPVVDKKNTEEIEKKEPVFGEAYDVQTSYK